MRYFALNIEPIKKELSNQNIKRLLYQPVKKSFVRYHVSTKTISSMRESTVLLHVHTFFQINWDRANNYYNNLWRNNFDAPLHGSSQINMWALKLQSGSCCNTNVIIQTWLAYVKYAWDSFPFGVRLNTQYALQTCNCHFIISETTNATLQLLIVW